MTYRSMVTEGGRVLAAAGVPEAELDAWYLLEYLRKERGERSDRQWYLLNREDEARAEEEKVYQELIERRAKRIPLQQITGEQEFMGLSFRVNEHVLIPRQDTEILVEEALKRIEPGMRVLDLCTGSGCVLLSVLKEASVSGVGTDISQEALLVAELNRKRLGVHAGWIESDLFENVGGTFQMILSNPPYIPSAVIPELDPEVREHEPVLALDGREDGLYFYRRIVDEARSYLCPGGWICLEIGYDQGEALENMLKSHGYTEVKIIKDLAGNDRVAVGALSGREL